MGVLEALLFGIVLNAVGGVACEIACRLVQKHIDKKRIEYENDFGEMDY